MSIHNHQTGFNLPLSSSFYYYEDTYGVACWIGIVKIGMKNCHHHCHQWRLQLKIMPRQQVWNFCLQRKTLKKKITVFLKTEIKCIYEKLEGRRKEKEAFCILRSSYKFMLSGEGQTSIESLVSSSWYSLSESTFQAAVLPACYVLFLHLLECLWVFLKYPWRSRWKVVNQFSI